MALKGINPIEQHVEKIFAAVIGAAVLGVIAYQFVGVKNTVEVGAKKDVPYDQAYKEIESTASGLYGKMTQADVHLPESKTIAALADFDKRLKDRITKSDTLAWIGDNNRIKSGAQGPGLDVPANAVVKLDIPAPTAPVAAVHMGLINPDELADAPDLKKYLPPAMPFDKASVSVEAVFDGTALKSMFEADPDGSGPGKPMPRHWWDGMTQILGVKLERQERNPDGTWGSSETVIPLPGALDIPGELAKAPVQDDFFREVVLQAANSASVVRRVPYYRIMLGEDWTPPSESGKRAAGPVGPAGAVELDKKSLELRTAELKKLEDDLQATPDDPKNAGKRKNLQGRIEGLRKTIEEIKTRLAAAGHPVDALPGEVPGEPSPAAEIKDGPIFATNQIRLWNHDITAVRGKTYRYRLIAVLSNPLFGHSAGLSEKQIDLAKSPIAYSKPSDWTAPIHVPDETYYFIVSAQDSQAGPFSGARASAELYWFSWGYWRKGTVSLEPGDPIAGTVRVPADMENWLGAHPAGAPGAPDGAPPMPPPEERPAPGGGGRGRNAAPGGGGDGMLRPPPGGAGNQPPRPIGEKPEAVKFKDQPVSRDAYLLDVAAIPALGGRILAGSGLQFQAYIRDNGGIITIRIPEVERSSPEYASISRSALKGEQMLAPKREPKKAATPPPPRQRDEPRPPAGGGRGGRGGGG